MHCTLQLVTTMFPSIFHSRKYTDMSHQTQKPHSSFQGDTTAATSQMTTPHRFNSSSPLPLLAIAPETAEAILSCLDPTAVQRTMQPILQLHAVVDRVNSLVMKETYEIEQLNKELNELDAEVAHCYQVYRYRLGLPRPTGTS